MRAQTVPQPQIVSAIGSWYDVDRPAEGERPTEREPGDDERVAAGRQAAQHAEVADDDDGRRSGLGPERVAGLRHDTELIGDGQEAVAENVLRRAAVDADRDPDDVLADVRQGAEDPRLARGLRVAPSYRA